MPQLRLKPPNTKSSEPIVVHHVIATLAALLDRPLKNNQKMDSLNLLPVFLNDGSFLQNICRHSD